MPKPKNEPCTVSARWCNYFMLIWLRFGPSSDSCSAQMWHWFTASLRGAFQRASMFGHSALPSPLPELLWLTHWTLLPGLPFINIGPQLWASSPGYSVADGWHRHWIPWHTHTHNQKTCKRTHIHGFVLQMHIVNESTYNGERCLKNRVFTETKDRSIICWTLATPCGHVRWSGRFFSHSLATVMLRTPVS